MASDLQFAAYKIEHLIKDVLEAYLRRIKYNPDRCSKLCQDLCSIIKTKTKELATSRWKLVVQVLVGEDTDQRVQMASRCLWNQATDNFASATFRNKSLFAIGIVYGVHID
ncbi:hypothetical protein NP493_231g03067 [Ridgeia piscesae]|uniref:Tctex1 domain-containing protein 1 n=1 Tax=Ridgeia piscesae TaxID=27915 RepID=A0AAD9NZU5_RIDPI|nr:hypothetical protein NP493_231g03067 [Ridgeia piscesae]